MKIEDEAAARGYQLSCGELERLEQEDGDIWGERWVVYRTSFHGGGRLSIHKNAILAIRAMRRRRIGGCTCGCAGVLPLRLESQLETQDRNQSLTHDPYALTR